MLADAGIAVRLFEGVENDPSLATCDRAIGAARESGCDMVVAIGGGSALDAGKIVAAMLPQSFTLREFFRGRAQSRKAVALLRRRADDGGHRLRMHARLGAH